MRPFDEEGDAARDDRTFPMPVFARGPDGSFTSQYSRTYISQAQEVASVPRLTSAQVEAMDVLHEIGEEVCLTMPFAPGEMQFMNQHVTYHGRTGFTDDAGGRCASRAAAHLARGAVHPARCRRGTRCNGATRGPGRCAAARSPARAP